MHLFITLIILHIILLVNRITRLFIFNFHLMHEMWYYHCIFYQTPYDLNILLFAGFLLDNVIH